MAETMIERVASAMYLAEYGEEDQHGMPLAQWNARSAGEKSKYLRLARAAIAAIREPTEAMLAAVIERPTALIEERTAQGCIEYAAHMDAAVAAERLVLRQRWQAMIDSALRSEQESADGQDRPK